MFDLTGKSAIITGSSKGIGKSIAMQMALHGAKVVVSSRKADVCEETAKEINACLLYTSPSPRDYAASRMPSSA